MTDLREAEVLLNNGPIEDVLEVLEEMEPENRSEAIFVWLYPQTVDQLLEHFGSPNWEPEIGYDARRLWLIGFYAGRDAQAFGAPSHEERW